MKDYTSTSPNKNGIRFPTNFTKEVLQWKHGTSSNGEKTDNVNTGLKKIQKLSALSNSPKLALMVTLLDILVKIGSTM